MRAKDAVVLGILIWLMLKDRPHSDVNITVTEPGFPPNVNYEPDYGAIYTPPFYLQ